MPKTIVCDEMSAIVEQLLELDIEEQEAQWKRYIPCWLQEDEQLFWQVLADHLDSIPVGLARVLTETIIGSGATYGLGLAQIITTIPVEYARHLARYFVHYPSELGQQTLSQLANQATRDGDRVVFLGMASSIGDVRATVNLLEMEAILGEFTDLGKDVSTLLVNAFATQAYAVTKILLEEGHFALTKTFALHLDLFLKHKRGNGKQGFEAAHIEALFNYAAAYLSDERLEQGRSAMEIIKVSPVIKAAWLRQACLHRVTYVRAMVQKIIHNGIISGTSFFDMSAPELEELVRDGLQDPSPLVREKAVLALKSVKGHAAEEMLRHIATSQHEVVKVRMAAITALTELLSVPEVEALLFALRDDSRFQVRLFVRDLEFEMFNATESLDEEVFWGRYYSFWSTGPYQEIDRLLSKWVNLFVEEGFIPEQEENNVLERITNLGGAEAVLRQVLDFYIDMEERLLSDELLGANTTKVQRFRRLLWLWGANSVHHLTMVLATEKDLSLRLAAIEALAELALNGIEQENIQGILLRHLAKTDNPPDQERILSSLYVFPQETYIGLVQSYLASRSPKVVVQAASLLSSFALNEFSCYNVQRIIPKIFEGVSKRMFLGKLWGSMAVYSARLVLQDQLCGNNEITAYLQNDDYLVRRFAREVQYYLNK